MNNRINRRQWCLGATAMATLTGTGALWPLAARAADAWPSRAIRLVVPFAPAGTSDILARLLGDKLSQALGQPVVVENKAGAGGVIGADAAAKSAPDGYTFLLGTISSHAINPNFQKGVPYDPVKDFAPVDLIGSISNVLLTGASQPYKSVADVVAAAKASPGTLAFGSAGTGSSQHMSGEVFKQLAGIDLIHVPYKGSGPAISDLIAGQIPLSFDTVTVAKAQIDGGKVRALAVTSAKRSAALPDVPTMQEAGIAGFDVASWQAIYAPANTPKDIVQRVNSELERIMQMPDVQKRFAELGVVHEANTPESFAKFGSEQLAMWRKVITEGKLKPEA